MNSKLKKIISFILLILACYAIASFSAYVVFALLHQWPDGLIWFLSWPYRLIWDSYYMFVQQGYEDGFTLFLMVFVFQMPILWGARQSNKIYKVAAILVGLWTQIFLTMIVEALGV